MIFPLKISYTISNPFGAAGPLYTDPPPKGMGFLGHDGIDMPCPVGTPVYAAHDGFCVLVIEQNTGISGTRGMGIKVFGTDRQTEYWHLSEFAVTANQKVIQGELIGLSGNTGNSSGPHLHFDLRFIQWVNGNSQVLNVINGYGGAVNPLPYFETMTIHAGELRLLYNAVFGRDPDEGANGYIGQDLSFVLSELMKSKEYQADASALQAIHAFFNVKL